MVSIAAGLHADLLNQQWRVLELLEGVGGEEGERLLAGELATQARVARRELTPLNHWDAIPERNYNIYQANSNRVRLRRVRDFVLPGDRVLDIGCGYGYVAGTLLRDTQPEYYCGIDIKEHLLASVRQMASANGLEHCACHLRRLSVFDLTKEFMAEQDPDLILLLEVMEHLQDCEGALHAVASTMSDRAALLLSVPAAGRLEPVKGHRSAFDAHRLREAVRREGLTVHHVEAVHNAWVLLLASRGKTNYLRGAPQRGGGKPGATKTRRVDVVGRVVPANLSRSPDAYVSSWTTRAHTQITRQDEGLRCLVAGSRDKTGRQYGGMRLPAHSFQALRLTMTLLYPDSIKAVHVDAYDAERQRLARWTWSLENGDTRWNGCVQHALVPGVSHGCFRAGRGSDVRSVYAIDVFVEIAPGAYGGFVLHRAELVTSAENRETAPIREAVEVPVG